MAVSSTVHQRDGQGRHGRGVSPEYAAAAEGYFGEEQGRAWMEQVRTLSAYMARITIQPRQAGLFVFEMRFRSAIDAAMAGSYHAGMIKVCIIVRTISH